MSDELYIFAEVVLNELSKEELIVMLLNKMTVVELMNLVEKVGGN